MPNKAGYIKALIRADIHKNGEKVGKTHKIPEDIFINPDGRKTRNDKTIGAIRKEFEKSQKKK